MRRAWIFLAEYSVPLMLGALIGLGWANLDYASYRQVIEHVILDHVWIGHADADAEGNVHRTLTLQYLINDVGMAFFFAIAGKEVWEAVALRNGSLRGRKALTPLIATSGGMMGPIIVYLGLATMMGSTTYDAVANGWALPTATDIAFSYLVGRLIFGAGHPAVRFLLLLAIADDAGGLLILAIFYPTGEIAPEWLLLSLGATFGVWFLFNRLPRLVDRGSHAKLATAFCSGLGFWPYLAAAGLCWYGFQEAGIHPALGLLPIIPTIPHADADIGMFAETDSDRVELLDRIGRGLRDPVEGVLFFFGLANAGVQLSLVGDATWLVFLGLLVGKPVGIFAMGWLAARPMKLGLPEGMKMSDLFVLGCVAAIGFTVSLFVAAVAFPPGPVQDAAKMGALFSFSAALTAFIASSVLRVERKP